ncbi:MEDS domain-containing protein [Halomontanus rarus]|uniref:MEDS domain-containing protein n=1 Tax=Halomontanus rarus TaxID=3034020 RepID=UPI001A983DC1
MSNGSFDSVNDESPVSARSRSHADSHSRPRTSARASSRSRPLSLESSLEALRSSEEFEGPVEGLDGHESTDHLALIYESRDEQLAVAIPFVRDGLENGERCLYIADDNTKAEILTAMSAAGIDADAALESGALSIHTKRDTYVRDGSFDPQNMIEFIDGVITEATELDGYPGLRITGEMTWILGTDVDSSSLIEYEGRLNDFIPEKECIALCQYNRERFDPNVIRDILRTHPHLIYGGAVCQNFYYTPPAEFFGPEQPSHDVDRMLETLRGRTLAKETLRERERGLEGLNDLSRALIDADAEAIGDHLLEATRTILGAPLSSVWWYDEERGGLRRHGVVEDGDEEAENGDGAGPNGVGDGDEHDDRPNALADDSVVELAWNSFVTGDPVTPGVTRDRSGSDRDGRSSSSSSSGTRSRSESTELENTTEPVLVLPLGRHGVLAVRWLADASARTRIDDVTVDFASAIAQSARTALDRAEREASLHDRERELAAQNDQLQRLGRINDVIRDIDQVLVRAAGRGQIEREVCERLADADPCTFVWIGGYDTRSDQVRPRAWAGEGADYLQTMSSIECDEGRDEFEHPPCAAIRSGTPQIVENTLREPSYEPWRGSALANEFHSVLSVPIRYESSTYGALTMYADRPAVFDETEREVFAELGETIGHAINAVESKRALVADSAVELEFHVTDRAFRPIRLASRADCTVEFTGTVPQSDGSSLVFFTTTGASAETVLEAAKDDEGIAEITCLDGAEAETGDEGGDECFFECRLTATNAIATLVEHGGVPQAIDADRDEATVVVELPKRANVRTFVETFMEGYDDAELVARREHDRPLQTTRDLKSTLMNRLTERQREVLHTAYFSGFFESPRVTTAQEVAETIGISQPTASGHIRAGERKLFELLFDEYDCVDESR